MLIGLHQNRTHTSNQKDLIDFVTVGAVAQLGERLHGMQEVEGSNPSSSTKEYEKVQSCYAFQQARC